ncbi:MAG: NAD-dependent epimerase [Pseudomonadales bacterium]
MKVLVTGAAGFIGMHTIEKLLARGDDVVGIDNLSTYYDVSLKRARLERLSSKANFHFDLVDIVDHETTADVLRKHKPQRIIHLAAQVGVRYSKQNPQSYIDTNLHGFAGILEYCRQQAIEHLVYASSSSVYGGNTRLPFSEHDNVDHPVSLYAATKKANELMAHTYSHLYRIPTTGLRFFTVYGPWGRPDMAPSLFAAAILAGTPLNVFNHGKMLRDFTYIDDVVEAVIRVLDKPATASSDFDSNSPDPATSTAPYRIFNVGNSTPIALMDFIATLEKVLGKDAKMNRLPMESGDVPATSASTVALNDWVGFQPKTSIDDGIEQFIGWYRRFYDR